jgi:hypothetical protein
VALSITSRGKLDEKLTCQLSFPSSSSTVPLWVLNHIRRHLTGAFQLYDIDGDGYITRDEMIEVRVCIGSSATRSFRPSDEARSPRLSLRYTR